MFVLTSVVILAPRGTKPQLLTPLWRQSNIPLAAARPRPRRTKTRALPIYRDHHIITLKRHSFNPFLKKKTKNKTTNQTKKKKKPQQQPHGQAETSPACFFFS